MTTLAKRSSATVVVGRLHLSCMTLAGIPQSPPITTMPYSNSIASSPKTHTQHTRMLFTALTDGMVPGSMLRHSCCHHVIPTSIETCRTPAPPHRLSTRTPPGPPQTRRGVPSGRTLGTGLRRVECQWLQCMESWLCKKRERLRHQFLLLLSSLPPAPFSSLLLLFHVPPA